MYRRSKFLELLLEIRCDMADEADHDVDQFVQNLRGDAGAPSAKVRTNAAPAGNARLNGSEIRKVESSARKP